MKSCGTAQVTDENFTILAVLLSKLTMLCICSLTKQINFRSGHLFVDLQRKYNAEAGNNAKRGGKSASLSGRNSL